MDSGRKQVRPAGKRPAPKPGARPATNHAAATPSAQTAKPVKTNAGAALRHVMKGPSEDAVPLLRKIVIVETMIILVLALVFTYAKFNIPRDPIPFAINTKSGQPEQLIGLGSATKTQQALLSWVGSASADVLNFGFHNVYDRLEGMQKYFTDDGWKSFVDAVRESGVIENITTKQQVITAAPIGTPVILSTEENAQYGKQWTVQVPISVTILSGKDSESRKRTLTLILVTVPPEKNLSGLGIDRWLETQ